MPETKEPSFGWSVVSRAWFSAWQFFESKLRDAILFVGTFIVGGAAYYLLYGLPATEEQIVSVLIFTVGPMVGLWLLLFAWHLWLAPSALAYEALRKVTLASSVPSSSPPVIKPSQLANWSIWKQRNSYNLSEFAAILAKEDPGRDQYGPEAMGYLRLLKEDVMTGRLRMTRGRNSEPYYTADLWPTYFDIKRDDALTWAGSKGFDLSHIA